MGKISREAFKKLTLLYLVGKFKDGVYSSYRMQKVLYFATKNSTTHPFLFRHTEHGQYSRDARENIDSLTAIGAVRVTGLLETESTGAKWVVEETALNLKKKMKEIFPAFATDLDTGIEKYGYLKTDAIKEAAHQDDLLLKTPFGNILFDENLSEYVDVNLSDDECEDLEIALNEKLMLCLDQMMEAIESTSFNLGEVKIVESFL